MPFELINLTKALCTNANPRRELHGDEKVRAIDLTFSITGENLLLDLIEPGLREHHYTNKALTAGQEPLPEVVVPLPNLRFPNLPLAYNYTLPGKKLRGYRLIRDYGLDENAIDFSDAALGSIHYELNEGGSVTLKFSVSYNGDELQDNDLYGELSGLASEGDVHIKLLAPATLQPAAKGYRAGKPDAPTEQPADDGQGSLDDHLEDDDVEEPVEPGTEGEVLTPESALTRSLAADGA